MKKSLIIILIIFIVIIVTFVWIMFKYESNERQVQQFNRDFEQYNGKTLLGTDIATLINKAMDLNEKNNVKKNEKNYYIDNGSNSVRIFVQLELDGGYYPMERIFELNVSEFVKNFNLQDFKCSKITYHKYTKLVSEVYFDMVDI